MDVLVSCDLPNLVFVSSMYAFMVAGYYIKFGTVWDYRFDAFSKPFQLVVVLCI